DDETFALRVEVGTGDDIVSPVIRCFVRCVAHLHLIWQRTFTKSNQLEFFCDWLPLCHWRSLIAMSAAAATSYFPLSRGSLGDLLPHGCCQHRRRLLQWKPSSLSLNRTLGNGRASNATHTHCPTTWAFSQTSGIAFFNCSSTATVACISVV